MEELASKMAMNDKYKKLLEVQDNKIK